MTNRRWSWMTVALALTTSSVALAQPSPVGRWTTIDDETNKPKSIVEIFEKNGKLYGRVERLFRAPNEDQNPKCDKCEGALKDQLVIGMTILNDLKKDGDEWSGGTILDPNNGKTYRCYIAVQDGGAKLKVRGFIGFALLGRTQYWLRTNDPPPAPRAPAAPSAPAPAPDAGS